MPATKKEFVKSAHVTFEREDRILDLVGKIMIYLDCDDDIYENEEDECNEEKSKSDHGGPNI